MDETITQSWGGIQVCSTDDSLHPPALHYHSGDIQAEINSSVADARQGLEDIIARAESERTFENTLLRFEDIMTDFDDRTLVFTFMADEHPDRFIAEEAQSAVYFRETFLNEVYLRSDIAYALSSPISPDEEGNRLKTRILENFQVSFLSDDVKDEFTRLGQNLSELEGQYISNQRDGIASPNLYLMNQIIAVRQQIVSLLGFPSFVEYQIVQSGIKTDLPGLKAALYNISDPFSRNSHEEADFLLTRKHGREPDATLVYDYEIASLRMNQSKSFFLTGRNDFSLLSPLDSAIQGTNEIISHIFGITIIQVPDPVSDIPGMRLYRIDDNNTGKTRAWFYLLIRSSENIRGASGKTYYLRSGREEMNGRTPAVSVIVLTVPRNSGSSLLFSPDSLKTLFHEYGHMLRHSLSTSRYGYLSGGGRELTGYIEIPSHFLERFARSPEVLSRLYGSDGIQEILLTRREYDTILPEENGNLIDPVLYDLLLADLDLTLHSGLASPDFLTLYNELYENLTGFRATSGGADLLLNQAFFVSGNAGVYWHYVIDDQYADELFSRFRSEGVLNQSTGISFRNEVLEPAGTGDPEVLMGNFLGHSPKLLSADS